jgi:uncharacterized protein (DUF2147 family)
MVLAMPARAVATEGFDGVEGFWATENGWVIETSQCADGICGHIVGLGGRHSNMRHDVHNPDRSLRGRPLCGIMVLGSHKPNGDPNEWDSGWVYNPDDGKTYSSRMSLEDSDELHVRGYILTPALGRTMELSRVSHLPEKCTPEIVPS